MQRSVSILKGEHPALTFCFGTQGVMPGKCSPPTALCLRGPTCSLRERLGTEEGSPSLQGGPRPALLWSSTSTRRGSLYLTIISGVTSPAPRPTLSKPLLEHSSCSSSRGAVPKHPRSNSPARQGRQRPFSGDPIRRRAAPFRDIIPPPAE